MPQFPLYISKVSACSVMEQPSSSATALPQLLWERGCDRTEQTRISGPYARESFQQGVSFVPNPWQDPILGRPWMLWNGRRHVPQRLTSRNTIFCRIRSNVAWRIRRRTTLGRFILWRSILRCWNIRPSIRYAFFFFLASCFSPYQRVSLLMPGNR